MSLSTSNGKLEVEEGCIAYRIWKTSEDKPLMLLIPGCTPVSTFTVLAETLSSSFTVLSYERRGYGQSLQTKLPNREQLMKMNGNDAAALIQHFSPSNPVTVFGTSGGAMACLEILRSHSNLVKLMVLHEPPLMTCIADEELDPWRAAMSQVTSAYHNQGFSEAVKKFGKHFANDEDAQAMCSAMTSPEAIGDAHYFFKHEIEQVPFYQADLDSLAINESKIIFVGGALSKDQLPHKPMEVIAQKIGMQIREVAGGHIAYAHPRDAETFSHQILELVQKT